MDELTQVMENLEEEITEKQEEDSASLISALINRFRYAPPSKPEERKIPNKDNPFLAFQVDNGPQVRKEKFWWIKEELNNDRLPHQDIPSLPSHDNIDGTDRRTRQNDDLRMSASSVISSISFRDYHNNNKGVIKSKFANSQQSRDLSESYDLSVLDDVNDQEDHLNQTTNTNYDDELNQYTKSLLNQCDKLLNQLKQKNSIEVNDDNEKIIIHTKSHNKRENRDDIVYDIDESFHTRRSDTTAHSSDGRKVKQSPTRASAESDEQIVVNNSQDSLQLYAQQLTRLADEQYRMIMEQIARVQNINQPTINHYDNDIDRNQPNEIHQNMNNNHDENNADSSSDSSINWSHVNLTPNKSNLPPRSPTKLSNNNKNNKNNNNIATKNNQNDNENDLENNNIDGNFAHRDQKLDEVLLASTTSTLSTLSTAMTSKPHLPQLAIDSIESPKNNQSNDVLYLSPSSSINTNKQPLLSTDDHSPLASPADKSFFSPSTKLDDQSDENKVVDAKDSIDNVKETIVTTTSQLPEVTLEYVQPYLHDETIAHLWRRLCQVNQQLNEM